MRRLSNVGSSKPVALSETMVQYWFKGPEGVSLSNNLDPNQMFNFSCSDATPGVPYLWLRA